MLLREAEAAFGEDGGEALLKTQGGDGERDGERPRVGLLLGLCRGEKAWSIRPLRSWNICFKAPSGPNSSKKLPINSLDFSSHF